jgi:hypothetical protein
MTHTHTDDEIARLEAAVDLFAAAMKDKLRAKVHEGWTGWDEPSITAAECHFTLPCRVFGAWAKETPGKPSMSQTS